MRGVRCASVGDGSVPYVSLSFAHTWLEDSEERREEHRPSTVYKEWTPLQLSGSSYPAIDLYTGRRSNGDTTGAHLTSVFI